MSSGSAVNDRIVATLDALTRRPAEQPWGVRELAECIGLSRSTVHRVLQSLTEHDLATQTANATYTYGPRLQVLMDRLHRTHPLLGQARPLAAELAGNCDATVLLSLYDPVRTGAFVALSVVPDGPVRYRLDPGSTTPLHAGAAGRAILAELGPEVLDRIELPAHTPDTVTDRAELGALLQQARQDGITVSIGQHVALAAGAAAPLRTSGLIGAISVTRSRHDTTSSDLDRIAPLVREAAARASKLTVRQEPLTRPVHASPGPDSTSATARFARLISALTTSTPLPTGGRALGRILHGNPATTARLLDDALATGLATTYAEHAVAGPLLLRWAAALGPLPSMGALVRPALRDLAQATGETVALTELDPSTGTARMTTVVPGTKPIHYELPTGTDIPLAAGAAGKAILAFLPGDPLADLPLVRYTDHTPLDRNAIREDLNVIRERGWAYGDRERIDGVGIAVPYFADSSVAGSITITVPHHLAEQLDTPTLAGHLSTTAELITQLLVT